MITLEKGACERFVIVGHGAAGHYAADAIRKKDKDASIEIIGKENVPCYFRPMLSGYLTSEIDEKKFYVASPEWYEKNNIKLSLDMAVEEVDVKGMTLKLSNGTSISYDKLILANGSSNFVPPVLGREKQGVFTLKHLKDADRIKRYMRACRNAVVIGGGVLGLEAAWEMKKAGLDVTVVEHDDRLLPRQLDAAASMMFKNMAESNGMKFILGDSVTEIAGESRVSSVKLESGSMLDCDMALFSVGTRSNIALAQAAGIKCGKGVTVNERMESSAGNVYACGDVAEFNDRVYGTWPAAMQMGKVAGANAAGECSEFKDFITSVMFSGMGTRIFSCGTFDDKWEGLMQKDKKQGLYKKLFFRDGRICGAILLGDVKSAAKVNMAIAKGKSMNEVLSENIME